MKKNFVCFALPVVLLALPSTSFAFSTLVEIIQTIPEETALAQPDLRHARDAWPAMIAEAKSDRSRP